MRRAAVSVQGSHGRAVFSSARTLTGALLLSVLILPRGSATPPTSPDGRLGEARAARDLGFNLSADVAPGLSVSPALTLVNGLLADPQLTPPIRLKALRLKLQILNVKGQETAWDQAFAGLPVSPQGISPAEWQRQKQLWQMLHLAELNRWDEISPILTNLTRTPPPTGETLADLALLEARLSLRTSGRAGGFSALARAVSGRPGWGISDPLLEPYYGQRELQSIEKWDTLKTVLDLLASAAAQSDIAKARWLELAAPSIDPRFDHFPKAPATEIKLLADSFRANSAAWAAGLAVPPPIGAGYRRLLAEALTMERLFSARRFDDMLARLAAEPRTISDIPTNLWTAYQTSWLTLALAGKLDLQQVVRDGPAIESAATILPMPENAAMLGLLGAARVRLKDPSGPVTVARYFSLSPTDRRLVMTLRRMVTTETMLEVSRDSLESSLQVLAAAPDEPEALTTRALMAVRHQEKIPESERTALLQGAMTDGTRALGLLERDKNPAGLPLRQELIPQLAEGIEKLGGHEARERMAAASDRPVAENSELAVFLPPDLRSQTSGRSAMRFTVNTAGGTTESQSSGTSAFEMVAAEIGGDAEGIPLDSLHALASMQLVAALATLPQPYQNRQELLVSKWLLQEAELRGYGALGVSTPEADYYGVRLAELLLGKAESYEDALETLEDAASTTASVQNLAQAFSAQVLEALGPMSTLDSYLWGIEWGRLIDGEHLEEDMAQLGILLAQPLKAAYGRSDIQSYLMSPSLPMETRHMHRYLINCALAAAGDYDGEIAVLNDTIQSNELAADSEILYTAEHWRLFAWGEKARVSASESERTALYQQVLGTARSRIPTLGANDRKVNFAYRARWAAIQIGDAQAQTEFDTLIAQIDPTSTP